MTFVEALSAGDLMAIKMERNNAANNRRILYSVIIFSYQTVVGQAFQGPEIAPPVVQNKEIQTSCKLIFTSKPPMETLFETLG